MVFELLITLRVDFGTLTKIASVEMRIQATRPLSTNIIMNTYSVWQSHVGRPYVSDRGNSPNRYICDLRGKVVYRDSIHSGELPGGVATPVPTYPRVSPYSLLDKRKLLRTQAHLLAQAQV